MAHLLVAFVAAVILVAPYLFLQLWWLASPVLYRTNRVRFVAFALTTAVTFVAGALFGYFGVLPEAINFLVRSFDLKTNFEAMLRISSFLSFALKLMLAFGLAFELPVIMFLLGRLGVVNARQLWRGGRYAVVIIFVAAAVLSPPDVITQLILAVPLCLLYLIGVAAVGLFGKRQKALA
jgi:sec-independent protein translocase protein TatC